MKITKKLFICLFLGISLSAAPIYAATNPPKENKDTENSSLPMKELQRFATAVQAIKSYYVEPISDEKLFENAIRGMVDGLDPHSSYLDPQDFKDLQDATQGEFSGLGLEVVLEDGIIRVVSPIDDTPAQKAGIKPGDFIVRINDEPVKGMLLRDAIRKMRGKPGTTITLTIFRKGEAKPFKVTLTRQVIQVKSVKGEVLAPGYIYIRISTFQANTVEDFMKVFKALKKQAGPRLKGLVLDLRNDPGGLLDTAVDISSLFLDSKKIDKNHLIVYTKGRIPAAQYSAKATGIDILDGAPMVILINEGSASGAEIVAGALQDYRRAVIMGTASFGKGSVQTVLPLDNDTAIKLTTALYYTPLGRSIQARGIQPDITVEPMKFPTASKEDSNLEAFKEADLLGHLANKTNGPKSATPETPTGNGTPGESESMYALPNPRTDYQLSQALNLLKGLSVVQEDRSS